MCMRDARPAWHGTVAVLARHHRDVDGRGAVAQYVRRRRPGGGDKIVRALIGALHFGHLPASSCRPARCVGLSNKEKASAPVVCARQAKRVKTARGESKATRRRYRTSTVREQQPDAEGSDGPDMPGAALITPNTPLRDALTVAASSAPPPSGAKRQLFAGRPYRRREMYVNAVWACWHGRLDKHTLHLGRSQGGRHRHRRERFQRAVGLVPCSRASTDGDADGTISTRPAAPVPDPRIARCGLLHEDVTPASATLARALHGAVPGDDGKVFWKMPGRQRRPKTCCARFEPVRAGRRHGPGRG